MTLLQLRYSSFMRNHQPRRKEGSRLKRWKQFHGELLNVYSSPDVSKVITGCQQGDHLREYDTGVARMGEVRCTVLT